MTNKMPVGCESIPTLYCSSAGVSLKVVFGCQNGGNLNIETNVSAFWIKSFQIATIHGTDSSFPVSLGERTLWMSFKKMIICKSDILEACKHARNPWCCWSKAVLLKWWQVLVNLPIYLDRIWSDGNTLIDPFFSFLSVSGFFQFGQPF